MSSPKCQRYLGGWLLLIMLGCGACTGVREGLKKPPHYSDKTETDVEYGRLEAASSYHRPRGVQRYRYDETEVDLASPLASPPDAPSPSPRPGGNR